MSRGGSAPQVRTLDTLAALRSHLHELGVSLPLADTVAAAPDSQLSRPIEIPLGAADRARTASAGNRFCILPMEGWDATEDGRPTELVERRWRRFGQSGAALIWGGEAVAVRADGRANPRQLRIGPDTAADLAGLRQGLIAAHVDSFGSDTGLIIGLQLTHSGRFARPEPPGSPQPRIAYRHPILDARVGVNDDSTVLSDTELDDLVAAFVDGARLAGEAGFAFVDVKACHGYLGHELLSGVDRPGPYGGDLDGRARFLRLVIEGIHRDVPDVGIGVRLSAFDVLPHHAGDGGDGEPEPWDGPYPYAFGGDGTGAGIDLAEPTELLDRLASWGVHLVCVTAGSPYYNPHVQRPAYFPPSDGYTPPEDPLVGVARQIGATAALKQHAPDTVVVGSGYSYLQEWVGPVGEAVLASAGADFIGLGRMALSYPDLPADILAGRPVDRRRLCRTFSDCTTAPRNGVVSGCDPLDPDYKSTPERVVVATAKKAMPGRVARAGATPINIRTGHGT